MRPLTEALAQCYSAQSINLQHIVTNRQWPIQHGGTKACRPKVVCKVAGCKGTIARGASSGIPRFRSELSIARIGWQGVCLRPTAAGARVCGQPALGAGAGSSWHRQAPAHAPGIPSAVSCASSADTGKSGWSASPIGGIWRPTPSSNDWPHQPAMMVPLTARQAGKDRKGRKKRATISAAS